MDQSKPGKPTEQPQPASLASIVETHSARLVVLTSELNSAFSLVRSEIAELRKTSHGTDSVLKNFGDQLTNISDTLAQSLQFMVARDQGAPEASALPPPENNDSYQSVPSREPNLPCPKPFEGDLSLCRGFVAQCEFLFLHQASRYTSSEARVALIVSLLSGRALQWAVATLSKNPAIASDYAAFLSEFRLVFDHPADGPDAASRLHSLTQGARSVADYAVEFRILAAESRWDDLALLSAFRRGLNDTIKDLILRDRPTTLAALINVALQVDDRLRERRQERARRPTPSVSNPPRVDTTSIPRLSPQTAKSSTPLVSPSDAEPMQLGRSRLTPEVREKRVRDRLCLYCGKGGHFIRECAIRPKDPTY